MLHFECIKILKLSCKSVNVLTVTSAPNYHSETIGSLFFPTLLLALISIIIDKSKLTKFYASHFFCFLQNAH